MGERFMLNLLNIEPATSKEDFQAMLN